MKKILMMVAAMMLTAASYGQNGNTFWLGADISGTTELEAQGAKP